MPPPVLVDLSTTATDEDLLRTFTTALGLTEGERALRSSLHDALRAEPAWLIVDNCEHVEDAAAVLVRELLGTAQGLCVLATSRSPLGLDGERVFDVSPLEVSAPSGEPTAVLDAAACRLFLQRAQRRSEQAVTSENEEHRADLCRRLDGLPLAIEPAAAQTRWFSPSELLAQLDDRFLGLDLRRPGLPDRHRTLGHGLGVSTVLAPTFHTCCRDDRIGAALALSGVLIDLDGTYEFAATPLMVLFGDADEFLPPTTGTELYGRAQAPKLLVTISGGTHYQPYRDGPDPADETIAVATTRFWDHYLAGEARLDDLLSVAAADGVTTLEHDVG